MTSTTLVRERVYDPVLRSLHAWNGSVVLLLLVSGQVIPLIGFGADTAVPWTLHTWLGYGLLMGLYARLVWGMVGPRHARWTALWHPTAWIEALSRRRFFVAPQTFGHHPLASGAYLVVYGLLMIMLATGLALAAIDWNTGPLYAWFGHDVMLKVYARLPHEVISYLLILFLVAHLAALVLHPRRHGLPVAQAMVSGYQYLKEK